MARRGVRAVAVVVVVSDIRRRRRLRYSSVRVPRDETASDDAPSRVARVGSRAHRATARHRRDRHFFPASSSRPRRPSRRVARKQKSTRVERGPTPATVGASPDVRLNATRETRARAMSLLNDENIAPRNRRANDATPSAALAREDAPMKKTPRCDGTRFEI
jgi:hypothetical protein